MKKKMTPERSSERGSVNGIGLSGLEGVAQRSAKALDGQHQGTENSNDEPDPAEAFDHQKDDRDREQDSCNGFHKTPELFR